MGSQLFYENQNISKQSEMRSQFFMKIKTKVTNQRWDLSYFMENDDFSRVWENLR